MNLSPLPVQKFFDNDGAPLVGGLLYTYVVGTSTKIATYKDQAGTLNTNPVVLDYRGEANVWLDQTLVYKFVLAPAGDTDPPTKPIWTVDNVSAAVTLVSLTQQIVGQILNPRTASELLAGVTPVSYQYEAPDVRRYMSASQIADVENRALTIDVAGPVQNAHNANDTVYYPPGGYRCNSSITINRGAHAQGDNRVSCDIYFYNCNGFVLDVTNARAVTISDVALRSRDAGGIPDPRTFHAIVIAGTAVTPVSSFLSQRLFFQGWDRCHDWQYVVSSNISFVETVNCNIGVRLFGQCLNNSIDDSLLVVNGGTAAIQTVKDGATQGEGFMVSNTVLAGDLASGTTRGVVSDGFLLMTFDNCITDLFPGRAFDLTDCKGFSYQGGWVFSKKQCFAANDLGSGQDEGWTINTYATTTDANEDLLYWGTNNRGLAWNGGQAALTTAGTGRIARFNGSEVEMSGVHILNGTANAAVFVNNTDVNIGSNTGANTVEYNVTQVPTTASAANITLPRRSLVHSISGVTNITSLTATGWDAQIVTLIFQGILTFTDGGNLKLNGNFVTTADDTITLACFSGNWYEVARSAN